MKKMIVLFFTCIFVLSLSSAYAAPSVTINASCLSSESTLNITGSAMGTRENVVYILVSKSDASAMSSSELNSMRQIFISAQVEPDGTYMADVILPDEFPGGYYKAKAFVDGASDVKSFTYINPNTLSQIAALITPGMSSEDIMDILDIRYSELLIDTEFYNSSKSIVCDILSANSTDGYTKDTLNKTLYGAFAAYELKNNAPIDEVFANYLSSFMSYDADYLALDENVRNALPTYLLTADYLSGTFEEVYDELVKILYIKTASDYTAVQSYIINNYISLNVNLNDYKKYNEYNRDLIMQDMYARRNEISSLSDVDDLLYEICLKYKNDSTSSGVGSGGGSISAPPSSPNAGSGSGGTKVEFDSPSQGNPSLPQSNLSDLYGHWSKDSVDFLIRQGIVSGYPDGTYKPENQVTRAEYAKMISYLVYDIASVSGYQFKDVDNDDWFYEPVNKLAKANLISGFDGNFMPDSVITREEAAVIIYRVLNYRGATLNTTHNFNDISLASDWAVDALSYLGGADILNGYENNVSPKASFTRGEAAALITNLIKNSYAEVVK